MENQARTTMEFSLIKRINISFVAAIVVLSIIMVLCYRNAIILKENAYWAAHTREVLELTETISSLVKDLETGQRGYIISGDSEFLRPYSVAIGLIDSNINRLQILTADNSLQQQKIKLLMSLKNQKIQEMEQVILLRDEKGFKAAQDRLLKKHGMQLMDELREVVQEIKSEENRLLVIRSKNVDESSQNTLMIIFIGGTLSVLTLIAATFVINKSEKRRSEAAKEIEYQNIVRAGLLHLNKQLAGEQSVSMIAGSVIENLAQFVGASAGAIYMSTENGLLKWFGGYALGEEHVSSKSFETGNGLIGQVAKRREAVFFDHVPSNYWKVSSALVESVPNSLYVFPILHNQELKAVGELGLVSSLTKIQLEYLNLSLDSIGIALNSAQIREQVTELLQKTQVQAEELQAQQEELRASNEELEEKTDELETQQEELRQTNEELEEQRIALEEKQSHLEKVNREIERTSKYKSEFLANMSHELRTPLNSILLLSKLLGEDQEKNLTADQKESLSTIHGSGTDLLSLINDILDLSKVEAGKLELIVSQVKISEIAMNMKNLFKAGIAAKNLQFKMDIAENCPESVSTDRFRLEQILKNFISNAVKFTEKGSITLSFYPTSFSPTGSQMLAISVKDTGVGIPEDKRERIFEAFEQGDNSISRKYGGTGLGLTIARELSKLLGGQIQMESQDGKGSSFTLVIPISYVGAAASALASEESFISVVSNNTPVKKILGLKKEADSFKVLIIEDNRIEREVLYRLINNSPIMAVAVDSGRAAIEKIQDGTFFDCIILDLKLGDISGFDFLKSLNKNQVPPVIVYTSKDLLKEEIMLLREYTTSIIIKGPKSEERLLDEVMLYLKRPRWDLHESKQKDLDTVKHREDLFQGKKALLVDDDIRNIFSLKKILNSKGFEVIVGMNGKEALEALKEHNDVDIILMDIMMPEMDGHEAMRAIREQSIFAELPIIALTAKAMSGDREKCLESGASDYLAKPIDMDALLNLLRVWLTRR